MPKYILIVNWYGNTNAHLFDTLDEVEAYFAGCESEASFNRPPFDAKLYAVDREIPLATCSRHEPQPDKTLARYTVTDVPQVKNVEQP